LHFSWADLKHCQHQEGREQLKTASFFTASTSSAPAAAARRVLYSPVLQSILVSVNQTMSGNAPGAESQASNTLNCRSSGMAFLSQTVTKYSYGVSMGKENFQEAVSMQYPCFGGSKSLRVWVHIFPFSARNRSQIFLICKYK